MGGCCTKSAGASDINRNRNTENNDSTPLLKNTKNNEGGMTAVANEANVLQETDSVSGNAGRTGTSTSTTAVDALHRVSCTDLGNFVMKKMNTRTLDRLWKHLDSDASGEIEREEVLNILQFTAVLFVAFRHKSSGGSGQPKINKKKIKLQFSPVRDWILRTKMVNKSVVTKDEFRPLFGAWLKEYAQVHGQ